MIYLTAILAILIALIWHIVCIGGVILFILFGKAIIRLHGID